MVISVKRDCHPAAGGGGLSMRNSPDFLADGGTRFLEAVREPIAIERFREFRSQYLSGVNVARIKRDLIKAMGSGFGLRTQQAQDVFDEIWPIMDNGRSYIKSNKDEIQDDLDQAYAMLSQVARGDAASNLPGDPATWARIRDINVSPGQRVVVFSDHHFTAFSDNAPLENYFYNHNLDLYLDVLDHYADQGNTIVVENGDVEETIICELSMADAQNRRNTAKNWIGNIHNFPIRRDDENWQDYLAIKGGQRRTEVDRIISLFSAYYEKIRTRFSAQTYVRLTGNHDTYLWRDEHERELKRDVSAALGGAAIHDILRISRNGVIEDIVMHGHQFDTVSIQHGDTPWALSGGELISECSAWCYQGPDRFWDDWQCQGWRHGKAIENALVTADHSEYVDQLSFFVGLLAAGPSGLKDIADDRPHDTFEVLLEQNVAWSHFRNRNAFHAVANEVAQGQTAFKFRHLDEHALVREYEAHCQSKGIDPIPRVTLGHIHEPRVASSRHFFDPITNQVRREYVESYANSGSAGRFHNLIWGIELLDGEAKVISWFYKGGVAVRQEWEPTTDSNTAVPSTLVPV